MKRSGLLHAIMMAYRNIRSYKMLSVTIVLSYAPTATWDFTIMKV